MTIKSDCLKTQIFVLTTGLLHDKTVRNDTPELSLRGTAVTKQSRF